MASNKDFEWLDRTLVRSPYHYALCTSENGFHKILKHIGLRKSEWPEFLNYEHGACVHTLDHKDVSICIVNIHKSDKDIEAVYALLAHEAVHIWQKIREDIGESQPSSEFEAYSIQNISQNLMESYKRQTSKKPKKGK